MMNKETQSKIDSMRDKIKKLSKKNLTIRKPKVEKDSSTVK